MKRLIIATLFICPSAFATYTTMTIEGVKQVNGVWTTAGVMDNMGFVRTTGAVSVLGTTRNLPVTMAIDTVPLGAVVKGAARAAGPIALAATAYELYQFFEDNGASSSGNQWVLPYPTNDPQFHPGSYVSPDGTNNIASTPTEAGMALWAAAIASEPRLSGPDCMAFGTNSVQCTVWLDKKYVWARQVYKYYSCSGQQVLSCEPLKPLPDSFWSSLPSLTIPLIALGLNNLPSLHGYPKPITSTDFTPYSEWTSDPYFKDGNWWRDRVDVSPGSTTGQPTRVRIDVGPVKLEGQTDPNTVPETGPAGGNTQPKEKEQTKFCDDNPGSISCQEMGEAEPEPIEPDEKQFQLDTNQSWGASNGACPASPSVTLFTGKVITFDYQPTCDFLALLRPIIIAFALMTAIFIALGRTD